MFTSSLISLIGWLSARRIFRKWKELKIISPKSFLIAEILPLLICLIPVFFRWSQVVSAVYFLLMILISWTVPIYIEWRRMDQFSISIISAMDAILLSLRAGKSFREALLILTESDDDFGFYIREIASVILLRKALSDKNSDQRIQRVYLELKLADQSSHRIADRIKSFRYQLKVEESFRQKSRMATLQARAQSVVVGILYFLALIFDFANFSKNLDMKMLFISLLMFTAGIIWIWNLGKHHQWKV